MKKKDLKKYMEIITDFQQLNNYVKVSTVFFNAIESILKSDIPIEEQLEQIKVIYSNFKIDLNISDFVEGIPNDINKFDTN